jgi:hypothetical protein
MSDADLVEAIRRVLADSPFHAAVPVKELLTR